VHPADHAAIERRRAELVQRREELIVKWHRLVARGGKGLQESSRLSRAPLMAPNEFWGRSRGLLALPTCGLAAEPACQRRRERAT
jgi:hypothetical protein